MLNNTSTSEAVELQSMANDCTSAIVVYGLIENPITKQLKQTKVVVLFNNKELCFDSVEGHANKIMIGHGASLTQSVLYNYTGGWLLKATIKFWATLYKTIAGFKPNDNVLDRREYYNQYWKGGRNGNI